ncbi:MAG: beta-ketoacyl-ACP synthase III [Chitinivibrionales bacterium]|nr:beta-ketoacyl-ACP synthase III [Chitinivibrionales bacterium]MBD3395330.1 beta-ketoacyl-ACP synthase III [Chitinivibrionales bacterium]
MPSTRAHIVSVGTAVPDRVLTNEDLEKILDTSDEWITTRTGIKRRHVLDKGDPTTASELGARAASRALAGAGLAPGDIDGIICATFTPDYFFPSTACLIGRHLGIHDVCAFDISAACAGFVYGLSLANALVLSGQCAKVLVVGAEIISKTLDWNDRSTAILFGDGAGAVVVAAHEQPDTGILGTYLSSDGRLSDILTMPAWGERRCMTMKGSEVFKHAVRLMGDAVFKALDAAGLDHGAIDLLIPHQANARIISSLAEHFAVPREKVVTNLQEYGNTSSASIPLALQDAFNDGRITGGTLVALTSLGGGLACASAIIRF